MRLVSYLVSRKNLQTRTGHNVNLNALLGLSVALASQMLLLVVMFVTAWHFARMNKLMKEGKQANPLEGQVGFYYTL